MTNKDELERLQAEAKARWGETGAYRAYAQKAADRSGAQEAALGDQLMGLFAALGALRHLSPADAAVQEKIGDIQAFITANFYPCSKAIFQNLGQMYVGDERFRANIDKAGGEGTAAFVGRAIDLFCGINN